MRRLTLRVVTSKASAQDHSTQLAETVLVRGAACSGSRLDLRWFVHDRGFVFVTKKHFNISWGCRSALWTAARRGSIGRQGRIKGQSLFWADVFDSLADMALLAVGAGESTTTAVECLGC
jgi:hypothetical protein